MNDHILHLQDLIHRAKTSLIIAEGHLAYAQSVCEHQRIQKQMVYVSSSTGQSHPMIREECTECGMHEDTVDYQYVVNRAVDDSLLVWGP